MEIAEFAHRQRRLLSLDVGFRNLGWVVWQGGEIVDMGCIITDKSPKKTTRTADDYAYRSAQIARHLKDIINGNRV